jgi:hypothetical protein
MRVRHRRVHLLAWAALALLLPAVLLGALALRLDQPGEAPRRIAAP